jgi:uncharacterized protein (DUF1330 family)
VSCYFIAQIRIHDREEYRLYEEGFDEIFAKYNGEVIAVDDHPPVLEGAWPYTRAVMIRFPNESEARRWYDSTEYQTLAQHRLQASNADIILVKGRD